MATKLLRSFRSPPPKSLEWYAAVTLSPLAVALASLATAQVGILQIQVVEGEGRVFAPGAVVEATDETGRPVAGAGVSFHLTEDGPNRLFGNGLRTEIATTDTTAGTIAFAVQLGASSDHLSPCGSAEVQVTGFDRTTATDR
jgi:hypothetical protein